MNTSTMAAIREEFEETPAGTPIPTSRLLRHGTRGAVDQTLSRLMRQGEIKRATRGVYYRPKESRLIGATGPGPQAVVEALTESRGEAIAIHGAEAARQLGLTTQAPLSPTFLTSGRTKTVQMGKLAMRLQHASPREMALAGRPAGTALSALRYLGPSQVTPQVIAKIRSSLPPSEFVTLREETGAMPSWLSDAFFRFEHSAKVSSANEPQLV
jgi:N-methylhydantoinase A/oxoprolinase/acetone carboxylase beta subunit